MARSGVHHTRMESRSAVVFKGRKMSAKATADGVMYGSATTQNSTLDSILYTRGAAVDEHTMLLEPWIQAILMG